MQPRSAWRVNLLTYARHPFFRSYGVRLHSSLGSVLSRPLVYSTRLPVSVCGTVTTRTRYEAFLGSVGSVRLWPCGLPITAHGYQCADLPTHPTRCLDGLFHSAASLDLLRHPIRSNANWWYWNFNQLSFDYAFRPRLRSRLTLGGRSFPRNPWAFGGQDSHLSFRYLYRHSHFCALHKAFQLCFSAHRTLPYHAYLSMHPKLRCLV